MIALYLVIAIILVAIFAHRDYVSCKENERLQRDLRILLAQTPQAGSTIPMSHFQQVTAQKDGIIQKLGEFLQDTEKELAQLKSQQQSKSVRLGLLTEQVLPLHADFPFDYKLLRPMFQPIDYVHFGPDSIDFIEIKMGTSKLSDKQKNIKRLIEEGKVYFREFRVDEQGVKIK